MYCFPLQNETLCFLPKTIVGSVHELLTFSLVDNSYTILLGREIGVVEVWENVGLKMARYVMVKTLLQISTVTMGGWNQTDGATPHCSNGAVHVCYTE